MVAGKNNKITPTLRKSHIAPVHWQGHALREVRSVAHVPPSIVSSLSADPGLMMGVAERGHAFNPTDVVNNSLPMCRFVTAGAGDTTWLVALEVGGRGRHVEVFLFVGDDPVLARRWTFSEQPRTLADVVRLIPG